MQASAASFFPTAKELSSGVQWFKDHPVLAAAAATAVSVITYLNALELAKGDVQAVEEDVAGAATIPNRHRKSAPVRRKSSSGAASDSKLSAAVSWCDEHGGSLTQVFEDETPVPPRRRLEESDSDDETRDDVAESFQDVYHQHKVALSGGLRKNVTTQQLDVVAGGTVTVNDSEADVVQTESPQWGWYVPITPPQDQFHPTGRDVPGIASSPGVNIQVKSMRRTTSGKIS